MRWTVVIPVKPPAAGKSRLGADPALAAALALDTIAAAARASSVERIVVVTADAGFADAAAALGGPVRVVREAAPAGIAAAIEAGVSGLTTRRYEGDFGDFHTDAGDEVRQRDEFLHNGGASGNRAALLGDLPALEPGDLDAALAQAAAHPRAFVPDAEGTGTALVTATAGHALVHRFGADSARRHREAGLVVLEIPTTSGLRRDVDDQRQLAAVHDRLGPRTSAALAERPAPESVDAAPDQPRAAAAS